MRATADAAVQLACARDCASVRAARARSCSRRGLAVSRPCRRTGITHGRRIGPCVAGVESYEMHVIYVKKIGMSGVMVMYDKVPDLHLNYLLHANAFGLM